MTTTSDAAYSGPPPGDADFDDMHHALGRPKTAAAETYRNHYATEAGGDQARQFEALGWWDYVTTINKHTEAATLDIYQVNGAGVGQLQDRMKRLKPLTTPVLITGRQGLRTELGIWYPQEPPSKTEVIPGIYKPFVRLRKRNRKNFCTFMLDARHYLAPRHLEAYHGAWFGHSCGLAKEPPFPEELGRPR